MAAGRFDPVEIDALKARHSITAVFTRYGFKPRGPANVGWTICPWHSEKSASCKVNEGLGAYHCFGCGASGDVITALMHFTGCDFPTAVETLGGTRPVSDNDRRVLQARREEAEKAEAEEREKKRSMSDRLWSAGRPIANTATEGYLLRRGLSVAPSWTFDLRHIDDLPYRGFADPDTSEQTILGRFPAMLGAIRDVAGNLIGVHRTFLDPAGGKLQPPGDRGRNKAKKILGEARGGMIRLSPPGPALAIGEGIETTRSWFELGICSAEVAIAAGVSLGNLAGACTSTVPHPQNAKRRIPNGEPDMERPGVIVPDDVEEIYLIGDGDSDPYVTRASLLAAARRFRAGRPDRQAFVSMAPAGLDFNDVLQARGAA
jgi:hypothetical protein